MFNVWKKNKTNEKTSINKCFFMIQYFTSCSHYLIISCPLLPLFFSSVHSVGLVVATLSPSEADCQRKTNIEPQVHCKRLHLYHSVLLLSFLLITLRFFALVFLSPTCIHCAGFGECKTAPWCWQLHNNIKSTSKTKEKYIVCLC